MGLRRLLFRERRGAISQLERVASVDAQAGVFGLVARMNRKNFFWLHQITAKVCKLISFLEAQLQSHWASFFIPTLSLSQTQPLSSPFSLPEYCTRHPSRIRSR